MTPIPTSLRIAIAFIVALWIVGLTAVALGAPGEMIVGVAVIGTAGAFVEWMAHRPSERPTFETRPKKAVPQDEGRV
jgi:hypothetical protein